MENKYRVEIIKRPNNDGINSGEPNSLNVFLGDSSGIIKNGDFDEKTMILNLPKREPEYTGFICGIL